MLSKLGKLFSNLSQDNQSQANLEQSELKLASAALMVHAAFIDGQCAPEELTTIENLLSKQYDLSDAEVQELITEARVKEKQAVDLYSFAKVLRASLDQDGRKNIIEMLWRIILADGKIDDYENYLVKQVSELIGVSTRDRVTIRQTIEQEQKQ